MGTTTSPGGRPPAVLPPRGWPLGIVAGVIVAVTGGGGAQPPDKAAGSRQTQTAMTETAKKTPAKPVSAGPKAGPPARPGSGKSAMRGLDALRIPTGGVLVICKEVKEALGLIPEGVLLTPEKYQALMDRIERLERQLQPAKPDTPAVCKLSGSVDGDLVRFQAQFEFVTREPSTLVALGCQRAWPKAASLDGHLPALLPGGDDGLVVQVDAPGEHRLTLDLELLWATKAAKGAERGFDFGLPRAAITILEQFSVPGAIAEVRVNGRPVKTNAGEPQHSRVEAVPLGSAEHLDVAWKGPTPSSQGPVLLAAEAQVAVQLEGAQVTTEVDLNLQVLRGQTSEWRLVVPYQTKAEAADKDEHVSFELPADPNNPVLRVRRKDAGAGPVRVKLHVRQARSGAVVPVGPFFLRGAIRQQGTIVVGAAPDLRLKYRPRGDVSQREIPGDSPLTNAVAAYSYWNLPSPPQTALDLEVETVAGAVEARVSHVLRLEPADGWRVTTTLDLTPVRTGVDRMDVELPADYQYDDRAGTSPAEVVENPVVIKEVAPRRRVAQIKLVQKQRGRFNLTLSGTYAATADSRRVSLELPRPLDVLDRGGDVTAVVPAGHELVPADRATDPLPPGTREHTWLVERIPLRSELAWRPYRPEMPVAAEVDITLGPRRAWVQQRLHVQFSQKPPDRLLLDVPKALTGRVRVRQAGRSDGLGAGGAVQLRDRVSREQDLTLDYSFALPEPSAAGGGESGRKGRRFAVPLLRPEQATRGDTKVRVWSEPAAQPVLAGGPWEEQRTEATSRESLPALVLHTTSMDSPLLLGEIEPAVPPLAGVVIDRALIQVTVADGGHQAYRARFLLNRLDARHLDIEFPGPVASFDPEVFVHGKRVLRAQTLMGGQVLRVPVEPSLYREPVMLDIRYQMVPAAEWGNGMLHTTLYPPVLRGDVFLGRLRWQVELPTGWVPLYEGGGYSSEQAWERKGGLWAPRPAVTGPDLERWLRPATNLAEEVGAPAAGPPSVVCWRTALVPVRVVHVPQQAWLLACSLLFLALTLTLVFVALSRVLLWSAIVVVGLAAAVAAVEWPSVLPAVVYGCEPGAVVLVLVLGFQWMLQRRYRRQVVFLPGFTRLKPGSSLLHGGNALRARGEPSTVDAPPEPASSVREPASEGSRHKAEGSRH